MPWDADEGAGSAMRIDTQATCLGVDATGRMAALGAADGVHLVDMGFPDATPRILAPPGPADATLVAWDPVPARHSHLAAACPRAAHVWDTAAMGGDPIATLDSPHSPLSDFSWSRTDSSLCATASMDGSVRAWDIRAPGSPIFALPAGLTSTPTSVSWSPQPGHIIATAQGPAVSLWDVRKAGERGEDDARLQVLSEAHSRRVRRLAWTTDRVTRLLSCSEEGTVSLWHLSESRLAPAGALRLGTALREAIPAPGGSSVLTVSADATTHAAVRLWPRAAFLGAGSERGAEPVRSWAAPAGGVEAVAWRVRSDDAQLVVWSAGDRSLRLWPVTDGELERSSRGGGDSDGEGEHAPQPPTSSPSQATPSETTHPGAEGERPAATGAQSAPSGPRSAPPEAIASPDASASAAAATATEESRVESSPRSASETAHSRQRLRRERESRQPAAACAPSQRQRRRHRRRVGRRRAARGASREVGGGERGPSPSPQLQHSSIATLLPPTFAGASGTGGRGHNVPLPRLAGAHFCGNTLVRFSNFVGMPLGVRGELMACRSYEDVISLELRYQAATNQETHLHRSTLHALESTREGAAEEYARQGGHLGPSASPEAAFPELDGWAPPRDATGRMLGPSGAGDRFRRADRRSDALGRANRRGQGAHRPRHDPSASPSASMSPSASPFSGASSSSGASSPDPTPASSRRQTDAAVPAPSGQHGRGALHLPKADSSEYYRDYFSSQTALLPISHPAHLSTEQRPAETAGGVGDLEPREHRGDKEEEARRASDDDEEDEESDEDDDEEGEGGRGGGLFMWSQVVGGGERVERANPSPGPGTTPAGGESVPLDSWKPPSAAEGGVAGMAAATGPLPVAWSSRRNASAQDLASLGARNAVRGRERGGSFSGVSSGDLPAHARPSSSHRNQRHARASAAKDEPVHAVARLAASMEKFGRRRRLMLPASAAAGDSSGAGEESRPSQGKHRRAGRGRGAHSIGGGAGAHRRDAAESVGLDAESDGAALGGAAAPGSGGFDRRALTLQQSVGTVGEIVEEDPTGDSVFAVTSSLLPGDEEEDEEEGHDASSMEESPWLEHALVWLIDVTDWLPTDEVLASRFLLPTRDPRQVTDKPQQRRPLTTDSALAKCMRQQALRKMKAATSAARVRGTEPPSGDVGTSHGVPALGLTHEQEGSLPALSALAHGDFRAPGHVVGGTQPRAPWIASALQQPDGRWTRPSHACALGSRVSSLWPDLEEKAASSSALQAAAKDEPAAGPPKRSGRGAVWAEEDVDGLWPWAAWSEQSAAVARQTLRGRAALRGVPSAVCSFNALVSAARAAELAAHAQELSRAWARAVLRHGAEGARDIAPSPPPPPGPAQVRRQGLAPAASPTGSGAARLEEDGARGERALRSRPAIGGLKSWRRARANRERLLALRERSFQAASLLRGRFSSEEWSDSENATDTAVDSSRPPPRARDTARLDEADTIAVPVSRSERVGTVRRSRSLRSLREAGTLAPPPPLYHEASNGSTRFVRPDPEVEYAHALSSLRSTVHTDEEVDVETEPEQAPGAGARRGDAVSAGGRAVATRTGRGAGQGGGGGEWPFGSARRGGGGVEGRTFASSMDPGPGSGREDAVSGNSGGGAPGLMVRQGSEETWETQSAVVDRGGRIPLARQGFGSDLRRQAVAAVEESRRGSAEGKSATLAVSSIAYGAEASFAAARSAVLRASVSQRLWEVLALATDHRVYNPLAAACEHELSQSVRWSSHPLGRLLASRITRHALATGDAPLAAAISCALHVPGTRAVTAEEAARHEAQRRAHLRRHQRALRAAKLARASGSAVDAAAAAAASGGPPASIAGPYAAMRDWALDEASSSSGQGHNEEEDVSHRTEDADDEESGVDDGPAEASARRGRRDSSPAPSASGAFRRRPNRPSGRGDRRHSAKSGGDDGSVALWGRTPSERRRRGAANRPGPRPRADVGDAPTSRSDDEDGGDGGLQRKSRPASRSGQQGDVQAPEGRARARTFSSSANSPPPSPQLAARPAPSGTPRARLGVPATRQHTAPPLGMRLPEGGPGAQHRGRARRAGVEESREGGDRTPGHAEAKPPISYVDKAVATAGGGDGSVPAFGAGAAPSGRGGGPAHKAMRGANRLVNHLRQASTSALWSPAMAAGAAEAGRTAGDDSPAVAAVGRAGLTPSHRRALSATAGTHPSLLNAESAAEEARESSGIGEADASEQGVAGWGRSSHGGRGRGGRLRLYDRPQRHARAAVHLDSVYADADVAAEAADEGDGLATRGRASAGGASARRSPSPPASVFGASARGGGTPVERSLSAEVPPRAGSPTPMVAKPQLLRFNANVAAAGTGAPFPPAQAEWQGRGGAGIPRPGSARPLSGDKSFVQSPTTPPSAGSTTVSRGVGLAGGAAPEMIATGRVHAKKTLLDARNVAQRDTAKHAYAALLLRRGLLKRRALVLSSLGLAETDPSDEFQLSRAGPTADSSAGNAGRGAPSASPAVRAAARPVCAQWLSEMAGGEAEAQEQRQSAKAAAQGDARAPCALCGMRVQGLSLWCLHCGHGGHVECLTEWYGAYAAECPAGCGCACPKVCPSVAQAMCQNP